MVGIPAEGEIETGSPLPQVCALTRGLKVEGAHHPLPLLPPPVIIYEVRQLSNSFPQETT